MRRPLSIISAAVLAATSLIALSQSAAHASTGVDTKQASATAPASIPNGDSMRAVRLTRSNQMLVVGRDTVTAGANLHLWKINDDLSFDSSFGAVDLGSDFAAPTAANSTCVSQNTSYQCSFINSLIVYESADRYIITYTRDLNGTGSSSSSVRMITTLAVGKISTGEIVGKSTFFEYSNENYTNADWANTGAVDLATTACQTGGGNTIGGATLQSAFTNSWNIIPRPDGSVLTSATCDYSNRVIGQGFPSSTEEYDLSLTFALKPSSGSLVLDTSFGTNGFLNLTDPTTTCTNVFPSYSFNSALTSTTTADLFVPLTVSTYPRTTTVPNNQSYNGVTSYSGCYLSGPSPDMATKLISIQANGTIKTTVQMPSGFSYFIQRWVIDPQGRWNASVRPFAMGGQQAPGQASVEFIRLLPDGSFDTSFGTNGIKSMSSLPTTVTVNGTTVNLNYSISGFATTATDILFTGFAIVSGNITCGNRPYADTSATYYPYYVSAESGLLTTYGDNGLGAPVRLEVPGDDFCGGSSSARISFINTQGQHVLFSQLRAIGSQTAGLASYTWPRADDVTGGGDGAGAVGTTGRTDERVYSRKLPITSQVNTSLNVLTKKMSRTQMLRTRTPKVCVNLTKSVVLVKSGTCRLEVVNKSSNSVVRTLSTRVRTAESTVGTTVAPQDAIRFAQVSRRLSRTARTQITELAEAASEARRVIIVGHSAGLTENRVSNNRIALQRAAAVKARLKAEFKKAGVKVPISIISVGPDAPVTTKKTNSAQARNRRVEIFIVE